MSQQIKKSEYESKALRELRSFSEAQLQSKLIEPLLRSLEFENVRDNSGPDEKGKDLIATKSSEFGRNKLFAIQIKKKKLSARVDSKDSLGSLFVQLLQARDEEVVDPITNIKRSPDACIFITPYSISPSVWERFHKRSKELDYRNIEIIDGSKLLDLIKLHHPDFLDHFSIEVRYRYQMESYLNRIPESTSAFGLTSELNLDSIYVDASLSHSDIFFELIATRPVWLQGKKLVYVNPKDINYLKEFGDWLGCTARITDPPIAASKEEEKNISKLLESIPKSSTKKIIQLDLDQFIEKLQQKLRHSLLNFYKVASATSDEDYTQIVVDLIDTQSKLIEFRDLPPVWDNWLHLVKKRERPNWKLPQRKIPASLLDKINFNKYILGEPGVGKTTLLRRLAQNLLRSSRDTLPIFVPLVLVRKPSKEALFNACIEQLENQGCQLGKGKNRKKSFISKLPLGTFEFFLDGLDEVGPNADKLMECIEEIAFDYPKCHIMVSCRSTFIPPPFRGALSVEIVPFSEFQLSSFLKKWFTSQPSSLVEIKEWLSSNPQMRKAASNPLVAALLCSLFFAGAKMPSTEVELYERRFDLLLGKWDQAKGIRRLPGELVKRYWRFIIELAYYMHLNEVRTVSMEQAKKKAEDFYSLQFHGSAADMIFDCVHRGVLEFEAYGGLSFNHLTYQEYLAAKKLVMENDLKFILDNILNTWWFKTISFYAASKEDISSLLKLAIDEDCDSEISNKLIDLAELAPWTNKHLIEQVDGIVKIPETIPEEFK